MRILTAFLLTLALCGAAHAQQPPPVPSPQPPLYPPQFAIYYQPVYVPGNYYYVPRALPVFDLVFGPQYIFVPQQQR